MNERIKELAKQANVLHTDFFDNEWEVQKFAELIVKECIYVINQPWITKRGWRRCKKCEAIRKQNAKARRNKHDPAC